MYKLKGNAGLSLIQINTQPKKHLKRTQNNLHTLFGRTRKVTTPNWRRQDAAWQEEVPRVKKKEMF